MIGETIWHCKKCHQYFEGAEKNEKSVFICPYCHGQKIKPITEPKTGPSNFKVPIALFVAYLNRAGYFSDQSNPKIDGWITHAKAKVIGNSLRLQFKNRKGERPTFKGYYTFGTDYVELSHVEYARLTKKISKSIKKVNELEGQ